MRLTIENAKSMDVSTLAAGLAAGIRDAVGHLEAHGIEMTGTRTVIMKVDVERAGDDEVEISAYWARYFGGPLGSLPGGKVAS